MLSTPCTHGVLLKDHERVAAFPVSRWEEHADTRDLPKLEPRDVGQSAAASLSKRAVDLERDADWQPRGAEARNGCEKKPRTIG